MNNLANKQRMGAYARTTKETAVQVRINLDGSGQANIQTGIGFFDHMLTAFATHSGMDLEVQVKGDLEVDCHHTVEDTGIALGKAIKEALGDKRGIVRFASCHIPMDEALAFGALDISGRGVLRYQANFEFKTCGDYETDATREFMVALATNAEVTLHLKKEDGENDHHITEALYKAAARCFRIATKVEGDKVLSSKGQLV